MKLPRIFLIAITLTVGCGCLTAWAQIRRPTAKPQRKTNPTVHPTPTPSPTPTATPELHFEYGHSGEVNLLAFSLDGRMIASGSADETIKLWDVTTGKLIRTLEGNSDCCINSVEFSPNGRMIVISEGRYYEGGDGTEIQLWDVSTGKLMRTLDDGRHCPKVS
ncbi:MAG TPA: hypothetical protein PLD20_11350 [Blastocatellia bacterium]|nr:hypothetical protein [Blastocatellia bacterium]HMV86282.1 hypothetical protein [Blastocatellia bacterium]HMX30266.1 hypothetical protein [Blastocatellia bacterium]HMY75095.1 hypothetical protein [Blastocatellia bacterium]HMZ18518.1 hypothetical protein [Blastocatellia bacterium]